MLPEIHHKTKGYLMFSGVIDGNPAVSEMGLGSFDLQLHIYLYKKLKIVSTIEKLLIK